MRPLSPSLGGIDVLVVRFCTRLFVLSVGVRRREACRERWSFFVLHVAGLAAILI